MSNKLTLADKKAARVQEKAVIAKLKHTVNAIVDTCGLDEDRMARRVTAALKSEYGRVNGMINLVAAVCKWPAEAGDGVSVSPNQTMIEKDLKIDLMLLEDISNYKGYHTFHTDALDTVKGEEPKYEDYSDYCTMFLGDLGFERTSASIDPVKWAAAEKRAVVKTRDSIKELTKAVEDHKKLLEA